MSDELKARTKRFAIDVIRLSSVFPQRAEIRHLFSQVLRSSSSVAANYRAARRARSSTEFLSKLGLVEEECDETLFWLELLAESSDVLALKLSPECRTELQRLTSEADELLRIIVAAKKTTRAKIADSAVSSKSEVRGTK